MFYNSKNFNESEKYSYLKEKNWTNLDYLLSYGDVIRDYYLEHHKIYINLNNEEEILNLKNNKHLIDDLITNKIYQDFQNVLQCKNCNHYLSFNLKGDDFNSLKKLYSIITPFSEISQKLNILGMLYNNLFKNLEIKIDFENKNRFKNFNIDYSIIKTIVGLKDELINISEEDISLINKYLNRIKILQYILNSRNMLFDFSGKSYDDALDLLVRDIKRIKNNYI
jgi:hypothetical protein